MKFLILVLFIQTISLSTLAQSQKYFLNEVFLRSAIAYVPNFRKQDDVRNYELTWNSQVGISIIRTLDFGIQASYIQVWGNTIDKDNFYTAGAFINYRLTPDHKFNLFIEASFSKGNYCPCEETFGNPRKEDVNYLGIGPGIDYPIFKDKLKITAAVIIQTVINHKSGYNYGRLGFAYRF